MCTICILFELHGQEAKWKKRRWTQVIDKLNHFSRTVKTTDFTDCEHEYNQLLKGLSEIFHGINHFRIQTFVPLMALLGYVQKKQLHFAECISASKN